MLGERVAPQSDVIMAILLEYSPCCEVPHRAGSVRLKERMSGEEMIDQAEKCERSSVALARLPTLRTDPVRRSGTGRAQRRRAEGAGRGRVRATHLEHVRVGPAARPRPNHRTLRVGRVQSALAQEGQHVLEVCQHGSP